MTIYFQTFKWCIAAGAIFIGFFFAASAQAAVVTWDGGAVDNNWGSCDNWSGNTCPTTSDVATFDATSTKDANINATISVSGIDINTGYTGTITQGSGITATIGTGNYNQADGVFTGSNAAIDINGEFVLSAGTFNATTGTMTLAKSWTHTDGGTFTHNNGTVSFDANSGSGRAINVASTETFGNLDFSVGGGYTITLGANDNIVATGDLSLTVGGVSATSGYGVQAQGNVTVASTYVSGTALLSFTGSGTQVFTLTGATGLFNGNITVNNTGTVQLASDLLMDASGQTLTVSGGALDLNGNSLTTITYTQSGGTFTGSTGAIDINGEFTLSGGTFNATTGTMTLARSWTHTAGGTFTHNNGTVSFDTNGGSSRVINVIETETFGNLDLSVGGGYAITLGANDNIIVAGDLSLTLGGVSATAGYGVQVRGNVTVASTYVSGNGLLTFNGTGVQTFTLTDAIATHNSDIAINKASGSVQLMTALTLDAASQDLIIEEGTFDLNGNALTVNGTSGTLVVQDGGNLQLQGGETITANVSNPSLLAGSTVTYDGAGASYTLKDYTYVNLAVAGGASSVFALAANESLANLTITSGILDQAGFTLEATGTFSNDGTLRRRQAETLTVTMDVDSGTVEYVGDGDGSAEAITVTDFGATDYFNLKINDVNATKDTFSIGSGLNIAGTLSVTSSSFSTQGAQTINAANITLDGGTFTGGSDLITLSDALTISSGNFVSTSSTLSIGGNFTHTDGGVFSANGGTVTFTGNDATINVNSTESFVGLDVNKTDGQTLTITSGDTLVVTGALQYTNGAVAGGTIEAQGSAAVGVNFDGGSGVLKFSGATEQVFNLVGATDKFNGDIEVAKSGGTLVLASALVMDAAGQDLTITSGAFTPGPSNYGLTVAGNVVANGGTFALSGGVIDFDGNLTVAGGTVNMETATVTLAGNVTYTSGTLSSGTSTLTLDGTNQQISGATSWYNLTKNTSATATLTLPAGVTTTVSNTLTLTGAEDQLLSLRSSTDGVQHLLAASLPGTFTYLDIKDSYAVTAQRCITVTSYCVNSGNNTGWTFNNASDENGDPLPATVGEAYEARLPVVTIVTPNGGETYTEGQTINITWDVVRGSGIVHILSSLDGGETWDAIVYDNVSNGVYSWSIPQGPSEQALIKVQSTDLVDVSAEDESDSVFTIASSDESDESTDDGSGAGAVAERIASLPEAVSIHGLVKLVDDGDPTTQADSAVYYIGADGLRHAFPNERVYATWFCGFDTVQTISAADLATISLGSNVTYRPGQRMVKFLSVPKVYAVDSLGTLRWVTSEEVAVSLYGDSWNTLIDDISDAFYGNYEFGTDIADSSDYDATEAAGSVSYPSDTLVIPGYSGATSSGNLVCE